MRTGRCQCGEVSFESAGKSSALYICHCRECQRQSASAFGMSLAVPHDGIRVVTGEPRSWSRVAASGRTVRNVICPSCGTHLWHDGEGPEATIKAGCLDEPVDASAAIHIWTSRKLPGIVVPDGAIQFDEEPD